jgi:hypothetical protein
MVETEPDGKRVLVTIRWENVDTVGTDASTWATLYRCRVCRAYWELRGDQRTFTELSAEDARRIFPGLIP